MRKLATLLLAAALFIVASPLAAYVIYLKDGSKLLAKEKYSVEGERAIITLPNGTQTFLDVAEIDVPRTEEANRAGYDSAVEIDAGQTVTVDRGTPPPPEQKRLGDLISERGARTRALPQAQRESPEETVDTLPRTPGGWVDLRALPRRPYADPQVAAALEPLLTTKTGQPVQVFQGTRPGRPFVEITTGSEAAVFRALEASAQAVMEIHDRFGDEVEALEVLMITAHGERGGQFVLTPEMAADLAADRVEISSFFLSHVEF